MLRVIKGEDGDGVLQTLLLRVCVAHSCALYCARQFAIQMYTCGIQSLRQLCSQWGVHVFCMTRCTEAGCVYM